MISPINTKIIATLGPKTQNRTGIYKLAKAGVTIFRLNFSHGKYSDFERCIKDIRSVEKELNRFLIIMQDLQGPKIRLNRFTKNKTVKNGEVFYLSVCKNPDDNIQEICITLPELLKDIKPKQRIYINDGRIELVVEKVLNKKIFVRTIKGGVLEPRKGVNIPDTCISLPSLTEQDIRDLHFGVKNKVDYIAMSFVRSAQEIKDLKLRLKKLGSKAQVIAKIEKPQALKEIEDIVKASDVILIARGDLGVEIPLEKVPVVQKNIIELGFKHKTPIIVATQMLESMIQNPSPTRAETTDVFQAVNDGADAVMLSGETAVGAYPIEAVNVMKRIIMESEKVLKRQPVQQFEIKEDTDEAIAETSAEITDKIGARFVCCFTSSGWTARLISKNCYGHPVIAFTQDDVTSRKISMYKGVVAININKKLKTLDDMFRTAEALLKKLGITKKGERFVIVAGHPMGSSGHTNFLKVHQSS